MLKGATHGRKLEPPSHILLIGMLTFNETSPRIFAARQGCDGIAYAVLGRGSSSPFIERPPSSEIILGFFNLKQSSPIVVDIVVVVDAVLCCA